MTHDEKKQIAALRGRGVSYTDIASQLGLSRDTVKSYCRRNSIVVSEQTASSETDCCEFCGKHLSQTQGKKKKRFCSRECCLNCGIATRTVCQKRLCMSSSVPAAVRTLRLMGIQPANTARMSAT